MNYPAQPNPSFPQQPGAPVQPQFAPQQPQFAPQQGFQQPQFAPQQAQQPVHGAAANNLFNQFLAEPPRQRVDRSKPADGTHIVRIEQDTVVNFSQKDARPMLLVRFTILESTVPQAVGHTFGHPLFWTTRNQLQDLADLAKYVYGPQLQAVTQQAGGNPQMLAQVMSQTMRGLYAKLVTRRSQKQLRAGTPYDDCYVNHEFSMFSQQQFPLASVAAPALPQAAPLPPPMGAAPGAMPQPMGLPQAQQFTQQPQQQAPIPGAYAPQPQQQFAPPAAPQTPYAAQPPVAPATFIPPTPGR